MKIILFLIPILMFSQRLDSLEVIFSNPNGSPVQGVKKGYSKLIFQTGIKNLSIEPEFTVAGSEHFQIFSRADGVEIHINVMKLEKDREPGVFSNLIFQIKHLNYIEYPMDISIKPGLSYRFIVNPMNENTAVAGLDNLISELNSLIEDQVYDEALNQIRTGKLIFGEHTELIAYELYISYLMNPIKSIENYEKFVNFDRLNGVYLLKNSVLELISSLDQSLYNRIVGMNAKEEYKASFDLLEKYLNLFEFMSSVNTNVHTNYETINKMKNTLIANIDMQNNGIAKNVNLVVRITPPGMNLYINGNLADVKRTSLTEDIEQLEAVINETIYSKIKTYQIDWEIRDPDEDYYPLTHMNYNDIGNEWMISFETKETKAINRLVLMQEVESNYSKYILGGVGLIGAAILFTSDDEGGSKSKKIPVPTLPDSKVRKKPFMLNLGVSF